MWRSILSFQFVFRVGILLVLATFTSFPSGNSYGQARQAPRTTVTPTEQGAVASITMGSPRASHHPSRVIVRFRNGVRDFLPGSSAARALAGNRDLFLVSIPPGLSVAEAVRSYKANPNVLYAEPDYEVQALENPNDKLWPNQWDMIKIAAPDAWDSQTDASDVVVAVVDTGIDFAHPDLQDNLWSDAYDNHGFTCINGSCIYGGQDDYGHGTHVAGTIGASTNNHKGIAGINWHVQMIPFKFLNSNGNGYTSDAIAAFEKILELKYLHNVNIRVTNNSWGGGNYSQALKDTMAAVEDAGIVNVCAAGNSSQNADVTPMYPAAYDNRGIISVLATDSNDAGAYFSNFGLSTVDIAAPGMNTLSTVPIGICALCDASGYRYLSGTSMATPHVSGVMAALFHLNPKLTAEAARDVILDPDSYDELTDVRAQSTSSGGRVNFFKAIQNPRLNAPEPLNHFPTLTLGSDIYAAGGSTVYLTANASDADKSDNLRMEWTKSAGVGSSWLFGWMTNSLFPSPGGGNPSFTAPTVARAVTAAYNASVADGRGGGASGRQYVTASAASGQNGPPTGSMSVSPPSGSAGTTVTVNYQPVDPDGQGQTAWDLWVTGNSTASGACCYTDSSTTVTFYSAGVYRVNVQAIDHALDLSAKQTEVVRIGGATGVPPIAHAILDRLDGPIPLTVNIDMSASSDPDGAIQHYYIDCGGGDWAAGSSASAASCTYDTPGIYWVLMQIQDNSGLMDVMSTYVVATPAGSGESLPEPPTGLTAVAGDASVALSWTASENADSYNVKRATSLSGLYTKIADRITSLSYEDHDVSNCIIYYYMVSAWNAAAGESANSSPVQATPMTIPDPPTGLSATAGTSQVLLSWIGSACAAAYRVKRRTSTGSYSAVTGDLTTTSYNDAGLANGIEYCYVISAVNDLDESADSVEASAIPVAIPAGLAATAGDSEVTLAWVASAGATDYNVKRATKSGGPYSLRATVSETPFMFPDTNLSNDTTYYYVVSGLNSSGESDNSPEVSATPMAAQPAPTLQSLTLLPSKVVGGDSVKGTVTIWPPAPDDAVVSLISSIPTVALVNENEYVTIVAGSTFATFNIDTVKVKKNTNVKVTATYEDTSIQQTLLVSRR